METSLSDLMVVADSYDFRLEETGDDSEQDDYQIYHHYIAHLAM
jgi:hypothetical protein